MKPDMGRAVDPAVSDLLEHDPGSPEAAAEGCTCSPELNNRGAGTIGPDGRPRFVCDRECPLHGLAMLQQALEDGEARIIGEAEAEDELAVEQPPTIH